MSTLLLMCRRGFFHVFAAACAVSFGAVASAAIITGVTATASSEIDLSQFGAFFRPAQAVVNGSGMEPGGDNSAMTADQRSFSNNGDDINWLSAGPGFGGLDADPWFLVDLGAVYDVAGVRAFNYAENGDGGNTTNRGIRHVDVSISSDGVSFTPLASNLEIAQAVAPNAFAYNDFGVYYSVSNITGGALASASFRYLRLDINSNWGDVSPFYGLAELQVESIPEPSSIILLSLSSWW